MTPEQKYNLVANLGMAYAKLTRIAMKTDRSFECMTPDAHRDFMTIIDRAQTIIRLESEQVL